VARHLFDRRLLLVTGKGGVGKTTIATALALAARDRGLRVMLVQLGNVDNVGPIFGQPLAPYQIVELETGLFTLRIEPYLALHEYLLGAIKVRMVVDWFLENRIIQYLTQAAPGWRELITVGKIWHLEQMTVGYQQQPKYDLIVVDAPATGHGISFLRVPQIILNTLRFGPIRHHTLNVRKLLLDPARTLLLGVTLPEEMAVNEVFDIHAAAKDSLQIPYGATIVNAFTTPLTDRAGAPYVDRLLADDAAMNALGKALPGGKEPLLAAKDMRETRHALSQHYRDLIRRRIGGSVLTVPHLAGARLDRESMALVARALDEQIPRGKP